jgi:subtilisin family serine protease
MELDEENAMKTRNYPPRFPLLLLFIFGLGPAWAGKRPEFDVVSQTSDPAWLQNDIEVDYVAGEVLVGFQPGARAADVAQARRALGAASIRQFDRLRLHHWRLPPGLGVEKAIAMAGLRPGVAYAEPNWLLHADLIPDDPSFSGLWGLHNVGQDGGTPDADIDAPEAWDLATDAASIIVGIIDSGIDYTHEDLAANIWTNPGEIAGNGIDDDNNGYVDDVHGWDFANDDNDPFDDAGHGTHVSGTVCADGDNAIGVAGVAWTCQLMAIKFLEAGGGGTTDAAVAAVLYAADMGAHVTNNSWGGDRRSKALQDAIDAYPGLFVAAAGNRNSSRTHYPAGFPADHILSVAATDVNDQRAAFSNYGSGWVDLGAPGVGTLSTVPANGYARNSGTSMAAPHVAGVAALVMAESPGLGPLAVKTRILNSVDPLASLSGITASGGRLNAAGALSGGAPPPPPVDTTPPAAVADLAAMASGEAHDSVLLEWTASADDGDTSLSGPAFLYDLRYLTSGPVTDANWDSAVEIVGEPMPAAPGTPESMTVAYLAGGTSHWFGLRVLDEAGNGSAVSNSPWATTISSPWRIGVVDVNDAPGFYQSIGIDGDGRPVIAYSSNAANEVRVATWDGSAWSAVAVDSGGPGISLAVDPDTGHPAVSHGWGSLRFASFDGSRWSVEVIENRDARNDITSLAYAPDGNPCIAYRGAEGNGKNKSEGLKLACHDGSGWTTQLIEGNLAGRYKHLAFDADGYPLVAYSADADGDNTIDTLKLARWNGSGWAIESVRGGETGAGVFASLAYDPANDAALLVDRVGGNIRFHYQDGSANWQMVVIENGSEPNIAIDASGTPWVSYSSANPLSLKVAHPESAGSYNAWKVMNVDTSNVWYRTSIALKADGLPVVGYGDTTDDILKWAERLQP